MSKSIYTDYDVVTSEVLDTVKVGDKVRINEWKMPLTVKGVSDNYFVMERNAFKKPLYSVVDKRRAFAGPDNCVFGHPLCIDYRDLYRFCDETAIKMYLDSFERGEVAVSERRGVKIKNIRVGEVYK